MGYPLQREKWQIIIGKISVRHCLLQVAKYGHSYTLCVQGVQIFGNPHLPILFLHCDKDSTRGQLRSFHTKPHPFLYWMLNLDTPATSSSDLFSLEKKLKLAASTAET